MRGSRLDAGGSAPPTEAPVAVLVCEAGPASGPTVALPAGRHVVGRSPSAAVRIDDPSVEPHHVLLTVAPDGAVAVVQLTGRVPCRVDGEPIAGPTSVVDGSTIELGSSRLRLTRPEEPHGAAATVAVVGNPWCRTLHRTPRALPRWDPPPIPAPSTAGSSGRAGAAGLLAAAFTAAGSVVVAVVMGSPMFLVLGLVGVLASAGMWLAGRIGAAREGRRSRAGRARDVAAFAAAVAEQRAAWLRHHLATTPGVADAVTAATTLSAGVWSRRSEHGDASRVTLGWGPGTWEVPIEGDARPPELEAIVAAATRFDDVPVAADLGAGAALAVRGETANAVVRALIVQLATWSGPADWNLVVVTLDAAAWDWCRWLPHAAVVDDADEVAAALARLDDGRHVVVVTDRPELLVQRTGALRRFLGAAGSAAVVVAVPAGEAVPAMCRSVLDVGSIGRARWSPDTSLATDVDVVHVAGTSIATATSVARVLARLHDPEDPASAQGSLPASVALGELSEHHGAGPIDDAIAIAATWRSNGNDPRPVAPLGLAADGVVAVDLVGDGPHALVAGTTGSGKSELLRTLVVTLAAGSSPEHLTFVLVDYKGGATFDACADLPHTVGLVTDLDDRLAERALTSLEAELRRRERLLRAVGAADLADYRSVPGRAPLPRLVVVVDEFAALSAELPAFVPALVGIAQRGRSLGIHLVLATQRPAGVVSDDIRANTNLRLALRLHDRADAKDVVGDDGPAAFPRGTPGRAMLRLGPDDAVVFQAAHSGVTELAVLVDSIRHAAALSDVPPPHRPWLPALPSSLPAGALLSAGSVGIVDVPGEQRRAALRWAPADGNLALLGSRGAGTTTALRSIVAAACNDRRPSERHVYVIDASGDERLDALAALPHCAGVVRPHERERLARMLRRLVGELDRRRAAQATGDPEVIVAIDGMPALRAALDAPGDAVEHDALRRIVSEGAGAGIACVMTADRPGAVPSSILASCADRWLFHLDDPSEATACGVPPLLVPAALPGRVVVASTRLEAQLAVVEPVPSADAGGPASIGVLPRDVRAAEVAGRRGDVRRASSNSWSASTSRRSGRLGWRSPTASTCSSPGRRAAGAARRSSASRRRGGKRIPTVPSWRSRRSVAHRSRRGPARRLTFRRCRRGRPHSSSSTTPNASTTPTASSPG